MGLQIEEVENGFLVTETNLYVNHVHRPRMNIFKTAGEVAEFIGPELEAQKKRREIEEVPQVGCGMLGQNARSFGIN